MEKRLKIGGFILDNTCGKLLNKMDHTDDSNILYTQRLIMLPRERGWGRTGAQ